MKRIMPVVVTDDRVRRLIGEWTDLTAVAHYGRVAIDIPSDDQLVRDMDMVTREMASSDGTWPFPGEREAAERIREAFGLNKDE